MSLTDDSFALYVFLCLHVTASSYVGGGFSASLDETCVLRCRPVCAETCVLRCRPVCAETCAKIAG